jgi:FkbM family methyltransferase
MKNFLLSIARRLSGRASSSVLDAYLPKDRPIVLVDIGAHHGGFTGNMQVSWQIERAVLVEPLPPQVAALRKRFAAPWCEVVHAAVGAETGETVLHEYGFAETSSILPIRQGLSELNGFDTRPKNEVRCPMMTLDSITANLDRIDLLKIDVQGAEHLVLQGGAAALRKTHLVWTEVSFKPLYDGSSVFSEIYAALNEAGFQLLDLTPGFRSATGELVQADALFQRRSFFPP